MSATKEKEDPALFYFFFKKKYGCRPHKIHEQQQDEEQRT
jgi:hypothetical protein